MQLVITSQNTGTLETWRGVFSEFPGVTFQAALRAETPVDAVLMAGIFAFERYGGRPEFDRAQILENHRGDGWPELVIVPPSRPTVRNGEGEWSVRPEYAEIKPAYYAASHTFQAVTEWNEDHEKPVAAIEINLPLLDMDNPSDESSAQSFRTALAEHTRKSQ